MVLSRRDAIKLIGTGIVAASCAPTLAWAGQNKPPRLLAMTNLHTGESLESRYFNGRHYIISELERLNYLCRDFRQNEVQAMDKRLFDHISQIQTELGVEAEVQIISGYRSEATNRLLRKNSKGVAKKSYHMQGRAIDFRLDGVSLKRVRDIARELKFGGVGYYPKSQFVHIDTGPVRYWS